MAAIQRLGPAIVLVFYPCGGCPVLPPALAFTFASGSGSGSGSSSSDDESVVKSEFLQQTSKPGGLRLRKRVLPRCRYRYRYRFGFPCRHNMQ